MTLRPPPLDQPVTDADRALRFRSGRLCLYLVETFGEWTNRRYDRITSAAVWADWLTLVHLPAPTEPLAPEHLESMHQLRTALYTLARARQRGEDLDREAIQTVNDFARLPPIVRQLSDDGARLCENEPVQQQQLLSVIARDAVDLFTGTHAHSIRQCEDPVCPTMFVDLSRGQNRRWCSANCGARNAATVYRGRHRGEVAA